MDDPTGAAPPADEGDDQTDVPAGVAPAEVFVSYASQDRARVLEIVERLRAAGVSVWLDYEQIRPGTVYATEIVRGIKQCRVMLVMCSDAAMRSRNVRHEIGRAWAYDKSYVPLLLEAVSYPEQLEYWLADWQWLEVLDAPPATWLPPLLDALAHAGVRVAPSVAGRRPVQAVAEPVRPRTGLAGLRAGARLTDQLWPLPTERLPRTRRATVSRDLGAPQDDLVRRYHLGSRVSVAIELDRPGHLLLLDEGPSGTIYCLCPSQFAPNSWLPSGRSYLPQDGARFDAFVVTGRPGREHLLAVVADDPLDLDWMSTDARLPARRLDDADVDSLVARLKVLPSDRWTALATYFDVVP